MRVWFLRSIALALTLGGAVSAQAAEQRDCTFELAIFPTGGTQYIRQPVVMAANGAAARVRVVDSGEWPAARETFPNGANDLTFDTGVSTEAITIGPNGEAMWLITYKNTSDDDNRVIGYAGECTPWRDQ